jgi:hypothetical protein
MKRTTGDEGGIGHPSGCKSFIMEAGDHPASVCPPRTRGHLERRKRARHTEREGKRMCVCVRVSEGIGGRWDDLVQGGTLEEE